MSFSMELNEFLVACSFMPVLLATACSDIRYMKIPNSYSLFALTLFLLSVPLLGLETAATRAAVAGVAFIICFGLFAAGWFGGGDAKILPATFLFVPYSILPIYLFSFSACMALGMIAMWGARRVYMSEGAAWVSMRPGAAFPMGISIAGSLPAALFIGEIVT